MADRPSTDAHTIGGTGWLRRQHAPSQLRGPARHVQREQRARGRAGCRRREPLHTAHTRPRTRVIGLPYAPLVALDPALTEAVLERLGLVDRPPPDRDGLDDLYLAWCRA